jgi:hypothetical protein
MHFFYENMFLFIFCPRHPLQLAFTAALRQRETSGLRACGPLSVAVQAAEVALDAACAECIAPSRPSNSSISAVALADQRVQSCVAVLGQALTSQTRAHATLTAASAAARRVVKQVRIFSGICICVLDC